MKPPIVMAILMGIARCAAGLVGEKSNGFVPAFAKECRVPFLTDEELHALFEV
jgi:hypothetical protein